MSNAEDLTPEEKALLDSIFQPHPEALTVDDRGHLYYAERAAFATGADAVPPYYENNIIQFPTEQGIK